MKRGIWNKAALILFLLADFISLTVLKVRSILADEAFTPITSLAMGASAEICVHSISSTAMD
jgi:hypothetical protein